MTDVTLLLSGIEEKLQKLIGRQKELSEKMDRYRDEIRELKKIHEEQKEEINRLKEQYRVLKLSKTFEKKEGAVEAKAKINELVREIDKCIGLLNT
jgi:chromosome segregation ATPase